MNDNLISALGELQERLKKLESAAEMLGQAKREVQECTKAAHEATQAAAKVVLHAHEMRDMTMAVAALPASVETLKGTIAIESNKVFEQISLIAESFSRITRHESSMMQDTVKLSARQINEQQTALADKTNSSVEQAQVKIITELAKKLDQAQSRSTLAAILAGVAVIGVAIIAGKLLLAR
jgi:chromosome segregation ATPase